MVDGFFKWAHHEKIVIIDEKIAFVGGMDLCFGRYDLPSHPLVDTEGKTWPGKDYYNVLVRDVTNLSHPEEDTVDRKIIPRIPWHDLAVRIEGQAARDVARHFIERWNWCKTDKSLFFLLYCFCLFCLMCELIIFLTLFL